MNLKSNSPIILLSNSLKSYWQLLFKNNIEFSMVVVFQNQGVITDYSSLGVIVVKIQSELKLYCRQTKSAQTL